MKLNTLRTIVKLFNVASKDETRVYLCGVQIRKNLDDNRLLVEACDGHILSRFLVDDEELVDLLAKQNGPDNLIIDRSVENELKAFIKHFSKEGGDAEFKTELRERELVVSGGGRTANLPLVVREYPKTDSVIPKIRNDEGNLKDDFIQIGLNPELLARIAKTIVEIGKSHKGIKLTINKNGTLSPIVVELIEDNGQGHETSILTPMKV